MDSKQIEKKTSNFASIMGAFICGVIGVYIIVKIFSGLLKSIGNFQGFIILGWFILIASISHSRIKSLINTHIWVSWLILLASAALILILVQNEQSKGGNPLLMLLIIGFFFGIIYWFIGIGHDQTKETQKKE